MTNNLKKYFTHFTRVVCLITLLAISGIGRQSFAQGQEENSVILITNAKIFDGVNEALTNGDILIENNLVKQISSDIKAPRGATVIDADGKTVIPGSGEKLCGHHEGWQSI